MHLIVGLRNPEVEFDGTRHNLGAEAVTAVADRHDLRWKRARRGIRAVTAQLGTGDDAVRLALPTTSMNLSGAAVAGLVRYFDVGVEQLLVVHDDIDLPFGKLRVQVGRGAGGHNGVSSIIKALRTPEFWRLKMGVGRPPGAMDPAVFVLRRFTSHELPSVEIMTQQAVDLVETFVTGGPAVARQQSGEGGPV